MTKPQNRNLEREKKIIWLRDLRKRTQHLSIALRPQTVNALWMTRCSQADASTKDKGDEH